MAFQLISESRSSDRMSKQLRVILNEQSLQQIGMGPHRQLLREMQARHKWNELPKVCRTRPDWQTAGATYQEIGKGAEKVFTPILV